MPRLIAPHPLRLDRGTGSLDRHDVVGFTVLGKRWIVERTFVWIGRYRRMSKDYEVIPESSENMILISLINLMLHRLAPGWETSYAPPAHAEDSVVRSASHVPCPCYIQGTPLGSPLSLVRPCTTLSGTLPFAPPSHASRPSPTQLANTIAPRHNRLRLTGRTSR